MAYPRFLRTENRVWQAAWKSSSLEQILLNRIIWDLTMPLNVWGGWYEDLCRSSWVSVGLKYTLVSSLPVSAKLSPLKIVTSKKSILWLSIFALSFMFGWCELSMSKNSVNSSLVWGQMMNISSRYLKKTLGFLWAFVQSFWFPLGHEDVSVIGCKLFTHGCATYL